MTNFNGNRITQRGGAEAGRGDNPHQKPIQRSKTFKEDEGFTQYTPSAMTQENSWTAHHVKF